ncbi:MAG: hypothetical protein ACTINM_08845 [Acetobacter cibinongensis]
MAGRLVRLGVVIATLIMGLFVLGSLYKNFSHLQTPPAADTPVDHAPSAQQ